jgi:hypothetical protein
MSDLYYPRTKEVLAKRPGSSEPVELWAADAALTMDFIA